ncbi:hypothetical protein FQR65_LT11020 [Abscondita terminalis]|nr:hypothetical protein FQR65_LT11020 [Abscondita terminalis]
MEIQTGRTQLFMEPTSFMSLDELGNRAQSSYYPPIISRKLTEEFLDLLQLITPTQYFPQLIQIKNEVQRLVLNNELEVARIMYYAKSFPNITNFNRLLVALFALRDTLPQSCTIKKHLRNLLLYSIINKEALTGAVHPYEQICKDVLSSLNPNTYCRNLCDKMHALPNTCSSDGYLGKEVPEVSDLTDQVLRSDSEILESVTVTNDNIPERLNQLISMLPKPQIEEEVDKYRTLTNFLHSSEIQKYLQNFNLEEYHDEDLLKKLLEHLTNIDFPLDVQESSKFYIHYEKNVLEILRKKHNFSALIQFLPEALIEEEENYYHTAVSFLNSDEIYYHFKSTDFSKYQDVQSLFKAVITSVANSQTLDSKIVEAFKFYADYEDYNDLELITKQVIFKNFKILKLFKNVLNIHSLDENTLTQFKILLRYMSKNAEILKNFEIPLEVHTRAELVIAILEHFYFHSEVPDSIKNIMEIIKTHVIFTGEGAVVV